MKPTDDIAEVVLLIFYVLKFKSSLFFFFEFHDEPGMHKIK